MTAILIGLVIADTIVTTIILNRLKARAEELESATKYNSDCITSLRMNQLKDKIEAAPDFSEAEAIKSAYPKLDQLGKIPAYSPPPIYESWSFSTHVPTQKPKRKKSPKTKKVTKSKRK